MNNANLQLAKSHKIQCCFGDYMAITVTVPQQSTFFRQSLTEIIYRKKTIASRMGLCIVAFQHFPHRFMINDQNNRPNISSFFSKLNSSLNLSILLLSWELVRKLLSWTHRRHNKQRKFCIVVYIASLLFLYRQSNYHSMCCYGSLV